MFTYSNIYIYTSIPIQIYTHIYTRIYPYMNRHAIKYIVVVYRIGCLKLQVIFRKRACNYRALLRKMTYEDKASYGSSPPCTTD